MLSIEDLSAGYGRTLVLHDVTMRVRAGEFIGFLGPNGSGKTTLLRTISGVLPAARGQVLVDGTPLHTIPRRTLARTMASLTQDVVVDLSFTVREIALMGRWPHLSRFGRENRRDHEIVEWAMALADVSGLADRLTSEISGGERHRAFMAMCLAQEPRILLLDEPTNHLDIGHQLSLLDLIRKLNRENAVTIAGVFHDLNLAAEYCDRLVLLNRGHVEAMGTPADVLTAEVIETVYGASVVAETNPISNKPHIVVSAGMNTCESCLHHVLPTMPHGRKE